MREPILVQYHGDSASLSMLEYSRRKAYTARAFNAPSAFDPAKIIRKPRPGGGFLLARNDFTIRGVGRSNAPLTAPDTHKGKAASGDCT